MKKRLFLSLLLVFTTACNLADVPQARIEAAEEYDDDDDDGDEVYWIGPGWYWGIYINNEDDYWNHYHNRYPNRDGRRDRRDGGRRGDGHGGGGGHGHGGGGHGVGHR